MSVRPVHILYDRPNSFQFYIAGCKNQESIQSYIPNSHLDITKRSKLSALSQQVTTRHKKKTDVHKGIANTDRKKHKRSIALERSVKYFTGGLKPTMAWMCHKTLPSTFKVKATTLTLKSSVAHIISSPGHIDSKDMPESDYSAPYLMDCCEIWNNALHGYEVLQQDFKIPAKVALKGSPTGAPQTAQVILSGRFLSAS